MTPSENRRKLPTRTKILIVSGILIVALTFAFFSVGFVAYTDWAFVSSNSGSRKGYREWFFGTQTRNWYQRSAVEDYIATNGPTNFEHRWISYAGTGYDIYGLKVLYGHGRPGAILHVKPDLLSEWFNARTENEKRSFCDLLSSTNRETIRVVFDTIWDWKTDAVENDKK